MKLFFNIVFVFTISIAGFSQSLKPSYTVKLPDVIHETSGLEIFGDSIFVTHNDSGDGPILYFIDSLGNLLKQKKLLTAQSFDWEDITYDGKKYLYIGDIGNNSNQREKLEVHRLNIFDSTFKTGAIGYADQKFPTKEINKNFDVEGMAYYKDEIFLFTKDNSKPYTGYTKMYKYTFNEKSKEYLSVADSIYLGDGGFLSHSVTAADFNDDYSVLAILTYKYLYLFYDFPEGKPFQGKMAEFSLPIIHQREAICFDSKNNLWMTDEKSKLLNGGKLYRFDLNDFYNGQYEFDYLSGSLSISHSMDWSNENIRKLKVSGKLTNLGNYEVHFLDKGKVVSKTKVENKKEISLSQNINKYSLQSQELFIRIYKENKLVYQKLIEE